MKILRSLSVFFSTILMYLGILLLGWGVLHLPEYFASGPRAGYAAVVALFSLGFAVQAFHSMEGIRDAPGQKEKTVRRQTVIGGLLVGILFGGLFLVPFASRRGWGLFDDTALLSWAGVALCALGYGLVVWSGLALGRQYSAEVTIQAGHQLITSGPYRVIRHPRYLGVLLACLGIGLIFHSSIGLALTPPAAGLVLSRVHDEEVLLSGEFGAAWQAYAKKTWKLLPYVF